MINIHLCYTVFLIDIDTAIRDPRNCRLEPLVCASNYRLQHQAPPPRPQSVTVATDIWIGGSLSVVLNIAVSRGKRE